jgi:glycerol-3-phosphate dehydrogenase
VIGGGIVGAGVARDAALRGLKVALVERGDFAQGTSSRSSKMVHGGLRYLEHRAFRLVFQACTERRVLQRIAPHLVRPRSFVVPAYRGARPSRFELEVGMWLYDAMALFRNTRRHRPLAARRLAALEPGLLRQGLAGGGLFFDCVTDDARLTLANVFDAAAHGASVVNYAEVTALEVKGGAVRGGRVRDALSGNEIDVRARMVVNASGPWSDRVSRLADASLSPRVRLTKGVHIVVPRDRLGHVRALVLRAPQDGRVFFAVPWGPLSLVGTTDTDYGASPDDVRVEAADVRYLLEAVSHFFPASNLTKDDVVGAYAGLRPLLRQEGVTPSAASREHATFVGPRGFVAVVGGKLTTYRPMARDVVDEALFSAGVSGKPSTTGKRSLPGGRATPAQPINAAASIARRFGVDEEEADALYWLHGSDVSDVLENASSWQRQRIAPSLPYLRASLVWAFRRERAVHLEDALVRRVPIAIRLQDGGASLATEVGKLVAGAAGWDEAERDGEVEAYLKRVARENAWRLSA